MLNSQSLLDIQVEMPSRQEDIWIWVRKDIWAGDKHLDVISTKVLFKAMNLDEITYGMVTDRKKKSKG